ncbi:hypothetical protein BHM03_00030896 [Ensete ventricosum]|nr:hypothetical protein BHM03_00030896 [Ensete ventricosum]
MHPSLCYRTTLHGPEVIAGSASIPSDAMRRVPVAVVACSRSCAGMALPMLGQPFLCQVGFVRAKSAEYMGCKRHDRGLASRGGAQSCPSGKGSKLHKRSATTRPLQGRPVVAKAPCRGQPPTTKAGCCAMPIGAASGTCRRGQPPVGKATGPPAARPQGAALVARATANRGSARP